MGEERDERPRPDVSLCSQHLEVQRSGWLPSKDTLMHLVEGTLLQKHAQPGVAPQTLAVHPAASESWKDPLAFLASPGTPQGKGTQSLSPLELHSHTTQAISSCNCPGGDCPPGRQGAGKKMPRPCVRVHRGRGKRPPPPSDYPWQAGSCLPRLTLLLPVHSHCSSQEPALGLQESPARALGIHRLSGAWEFASLTGSPWTLLKPGVQGQRI